MYINIICDYQHRPEYRRLVKPKEKAFYLSVDSSFGNLLFDAKAFSRDLGKQLDSVSLDLCEIAAYVYLGDKAVERGRYEKWTRNLSYIVPVRNPELWNSVKEILTNTLAILSGDNIRFNFVPKINGKESEASTASVKSVGFSESDCSCLFSGGLDSFAGAVYLIQKEGRRPLFASHYVGGSLKTVQGNLMAAIEGEFGEEFHHVRYRVTSKPNKRAPHKYVRKESSHRARSFLFMSFAAVAARLHDLSDIFICENGVMSLNVPISDARKGSRSTRHAHPLYLLYFNQLINALYERKFNVQNPFSFWTKGEEVELLGATKLYPMLKHTVTCWGYPNQTLRYRHSNHCGYCMPCIVRRVSMIAGGMETYDDQYVVDVFGSLDNLTGAQLRNVEDLAYFCQSFSILSKTELLYRYPELVMIEAGADKSAEDRIGKIVRVYKKFAAEFLAVAESRQSALVEPVIQEASVFADAVLCSSGL
ncbi:MAG TPA: 7-cyano-7-deazaguanine synthase [Pyrinomonadaceae bacterium]|jgi:7-cyano-7-deazaguanine synthase in queuosine biosynthesis